MASLRYLWKNRSRPPFGSKSFIKAWAKRIYSLPELFSRNKSRSSLNRSGAIVHECAEVNKYAKVEGKKSNLSIGAFTFVGRAELALHDRIVIGNNVCINDGVLLLTASHDLADPEWKHTKAPIVIDDYAWVCTNAILLPGVHVGKGAVVGAGAVVSKNVAAGEVVAGNPAKVVSKKRIEELHYNPCEFLAANRAWLVG